jgi:hypothetical protein
MIQSESILPAGYIKPAIIIQYWLKRTLIFLQGVYSQIVAMPYK